MTDQKTAWVIGATSSLATSLTRQLAQQGWNLLLIGRNQHACDTLAQDVAIRYGVQADVCTCDLSSDDIATLPYDDVPDAVFYLAGDMCDDAFENRDALTRMTQVNFISAAYILDMLAERMKQRGAGSIIIVSSVAGDRGRASNYQYGATKAALSTFASGLRQQLYNTGVHVMTVKPGFIDTPMTYGMNSPLIASREKVASDILRAVRKRRAVLYTPWFWQWIMLIICLLPERIFVRVKL